MEGGVENGPWILEGPELRRSGMGPICMHVYKEKQCLVSGSGFGLS